MNVTMVCCPSCGEWRKQSTLTITKSDIGYGSDLEPYQEQYGMYEPEAVGQLVEEDYCSNCLYWMGIYNNRNSQRSIRVKGVHYWLYDAKTDGKSFLPFDGRPFHIRRKGFQNVEEVMMWYNAKIPEALSEDLFDNAEIVDGFN